MENKNVQSGGINLTGALLIIFIVLKLTDLIDWSWWWVLCPLWIPVGALIVLGLLGSLLNWRSNDSYREQAIRELKDKGIVHKSRFQLKLEALQKEQREKNGRTDK